MSDRVPLALLPRELARLTGATPPNYRRLYEAVINGVVPSTQVNGRWYVERSDLPRIATAFGLPVLKGAGRRRAA